MVCRDGTRLIARIWTPPAGEGPWPALLMRQPYGRAIASTVTYAHPSWYAAHGFLVVVQDVRGRGDSEGDFSGFRQEAADSADAVAWVRHLPGCNGRVGTYGFSYQGLTQLLNDGEAGGGAPEALPDCLAPAMAGLDERLHWASEGGCHWWALGLGWGLQLAAQRCARAGDHQGWQAIRHCLEQGLHPSQGLALLERYDPNGMALTWLGNDPAQAEGWVVHQPAPDLLRQPMLLLAGWHDPHLRGMLDLYRRSQAAGGSPRLHIGAWSPLDWPGGADQLQLAFFNQHLQHVPAEPKPPGDLGASPIAWQAQPHGPWLALPTALPLEQDEHLGWQLRGEQLLAASTNTSTGTKPRPGDPLGWQRTIVHDPWRPVPGRGGHLDPNPGATGRADLDGRRDVACFTSEPLRAPLHLLGRPLLRLRVAADQPGFDLCAALSLVSSDGEGQITSVRQLGTGVARFLGNGCLENGERLIELQPLVAELAAGDRLRLSLSASAWPQIALNPGDGSKPMGGPSARHRVITLEMDLEDSQLTIAPLLEPIACSSSQPGAN